VMKYWGFFLAKLAAAGLAIWGAWVAIAMCFPHSIHFQGNAHFEQYDLSPFTHDLGYTVAMMVFFSFSVGLLYLVIWDQRYRCRTCLRRLRMPVTAGSWPNMLLIGQPRTEYICIYGHGTLIVPEVQITGAGGPDWEPHDDMWTELESIEAGKK
jgi:hypothetical protein